MQEMASEIEPGMCCSEGSSSDIPARFGHIPIANSGHYICDELMPLQCRPRKIDETKKRWFTEGRFMQLYLYT